MRDFVGGDSQFAPRTAGSRHMPATFLLILVLTIALAAWLAAWWHTHTKAHSRPRPGEELQRLRNYAAWLEQRLDTARRERWDHDMIVSLSRQLGIACRQLSRAQVRAHDTPVLKR